MASAYEDLKSAVFDTLQSDSTVMDLTKGRIFPAGAFEFGVDSDITDFEFPRLHFRIISGRPRDWGGFFTEPQVLFWPYSDRDHSESWGIYQAIKDALNNKRVKVNDTVCVFKLKSTGVEARDPDNQTKYLANVSYQVEVVENIS